MRNTLLAVCSLGVSVAATGCLPLYPLSVAAGEADVQRRLAESNCGGAACARERWRIRSIEPSYVDRTFDDITDRLPVDPITSASRNRADGRLAVILASGALLVSPSDGERPIEVSADGAVRGLAWCNSGDFLGIVVRSDDGGHRLQLLDGAAFSVLSDWAVELEDGGPPPLQNLWRFVVSWSQDDARVVVSNDDLRGARRPGGFVITVADGGTIDFPAFEAHFIDADILAARTAVAQDTATHVAGSVDLYWITNGRVESFGAVSGPQRVVASDPITGVFVAVERASPGTYAVNPLALRTLDAGPDLVSHDLVSVDSTVIVFPAQ